MNRARSASWWGAVIASGLLLALPAVAANTSPEQCKGECVSKANAAMEACIKACPRAAGELEKDEKFRACMVRCSEKLQSSLASCDRSCPSRNKDQTH